MLLTGVIDAIGAGKRSTTFASLGVVLISEKLLDVVGLRKACSLCLTLGLFRVIGTTKAIPLGVSSRSQ